LWVDLRNNDTKIRNIYCRVLDAAGFFRGLEKVVFAINGVEPRCATNERLLQDTVESLGIKRSTKTVERN
jgi:hypothetical protein